jgi:hypothetical protein
VELTEERRRHIAARHPELLLRIGPRIAETILTPDLVRRSSRRPTAQLFSKRIHAGDRIRHMVVVVECGDADDRHWVVTAYVTRRLTGGVVEWRRS